MASLTLKNVPDGLLRVLRKAAERDRRSLNQEIIHLLDGAVHSRTGSPAAGTEKEAQLAAWRRLAGKWESNEDASTETKRLMKRRSSGRSVDL